VFSKYPKLIKDHHVLDFICDTLRTSVAGVVAPHDPDGLVEADLEIHHHASLAPIQALATVADALPGLGIVAAVLGVVITMGALGGPPEEIGHKVAAALVGTFLGILMCYGVLGPIAANLNEGGGGGSGVLRRPAIRIDGVRKRDGADYCGRVCATVILDEFRPNFNDEEACRGSKG
jgi:chemotaxis protein MotA